MKLIGYLLFGLIVGVLGLVAVALLITLLVGVVFALVPGPNPEVSRCAQILPAPLILLPFCPAIALGIWVGLGGKPTLWRLVGVVVAITACVCLARITSCEPGVDGLLLILMAQTVGGSLPLLVARAVGLELKDYSRIGSTELLRRMM